MKFTQQFRQASALFWESPWLLVPVLAADACKFAIAQAGVPLSHAVILAMLPQSVLGGYAGTDAGTSMRPVLAAGLLQSIEYAIGIALYLYALGVLARAVGAVQQGLPGRESLSWSVPSKLLSTVWRAAVWLIAVALLAATLTGLQHLFASGSHSAAVFYTVSLFSAGMGLTLVSPALRRFIECNASSKMAPVSTRGQDAIWLMLGSAVSSAVYLSARYVWQHDANFAELSWHSAPWMLFLLVVSLISSFPYALAFIGLSLRTPRPGLFVYGTLHPDRAPAEVRDLTQQFVSLGTGTAMGRLLDLGEYPGLVLDGVLETVQGEIFRVPEDAWAVVDAYEGSYPKDVATRLFRREKIAVEMKNGRDEMHWVYLYNQAI